MTSRVGATITVAGNPERLNPRASSSFTSARSLTGTNECWAWSRIAWFGNESRSMRVQLGHQGPVNWIHKSWLFFWASSRAVA